MGQLRLFGNPEITIELRRNRRARRLSLRVSRLDGRVTLTVPGNASQADATGFVHDKERWIRKQLALRPLEIIPLVGQGVLFEGAEVPVVAGTGRKVRFEDGELLVPGAAEQVPARVGAFLKVMARQRLNAACDQYAGMLGRRVRRISLRDTRSRWGSCTEVGNLMFSWRLIMAPVEVLDYVVAHEVAHLVEMNHSPDFWAVVGRLFSEYQAPRHWLRENGPRLHAYRFSN